MCRSIKKLRHPESPATDAEIQEAALQYVRKVSGYRVPSRANRQAFEQAVDAVAASTRALLGSLRDSQTSEVLRSIPAAQRSGAKTSEV